MPVREVPIVESQTDETTENEEVENLMTDENETEEIPQITFEDAEEIQSLDGEQRLYFTVPWVKLFLFFNRKSEDELPVFN